MRQRLPDACARSPQDLTGTVSVTERTQRAMRPLRLCSSTRWRCPRCVRACCLLRWLICLLQFHGFDDWAGYVATPTIDSANGVLSARALHTSTSATGERLTNASFPRIVFVTKSTRGSLD